MGIYRVVIVLLFAGFFNVSAQEFDQAAFLKKYSALNENGKIDLINKLPSDRKIVIWPLVKEDLYKIRSGAEARNILSVSNQISKIEGLTNFELKKYNVAIPILTRVISTGAGLTIDDSLTVYSCIIRSYLNIKNISKAFELQEEVTKLKKRTPDINPWYNGINTSLLYLEMGLYEKGISEFKEEYKQILPKYKDEWLVANHYNDLGVYYSRWKKADSAISNFTLAMKLVDRLTKKDTARLANKFFMGLIKGNIGQALMLKGEYWQAIPLLKEDIYWSIKSKDHENAAISLNELASCYTNLKDFDKARLYLDSASSLLKQTDDVLPRLNNFRLKAELFGATANDKAAVEFYKRYIQLKDSVSNVEKERQFINQQVAFEVKLKEDEISEQKKMLLTEYDIIKESRYQRNILITGILALLIIIILVNHNIRLLRKQKDELSSKNREITIHKKLIEVSLKEKETLIKEVHHRVKNNLQIVSSILNFQASRTESEEIRITLNECKQRILSIALTHEFLYKSDNITLINMKDYLMGLCDQIKFTYQNPLKEIVTNCDIIDVKMDIDTALPVGLILNELVSNAYKHAFTGKNGTITVLLNKQKEDVFLLQVFDDGKGLPEKVTAQNDVNMGLELVEILGAQISAKVEMENRDGAYFSFRFKAGKYVN